MNSITVIVFALFICAAVGQGYNKKLDNVNIETILSNDRVLTNYINCLLGKGACTQEGRELKRLLPDAIQTDCPKCTDVQRRNSRKVITFLRTKRAQDWKKLTAIYDPQGLFYKRHGLSK